MITYSNTRNTRVFFSTVFFFSHLLSFRIHHASLDLSLLAQKHLTVLPRNPRKMCSLIAFPSNQIIKNKGNQRRIKSRSLSNARAICQNNAVPESFATNYRLLSFSKKKTAELPFLNCFVFER